MGAGASAQAGHLFGPPDGTQDPEAEWRSENARELDRLGGNQRPALKRGQSTKYRLEWLKEALHEQGDRLEEALAKDPMAGRHEIMRQEALKVSRTLGPGHHRLTVREWQTMKHTDLRAQQARDELERKLRERDKARVSDQDRPAWNTYFASSTSTSTASIIVPPMPEGLVGSSARRLSPLTASSPAFLSPTSSVAVGGGGGAADGEQQQPSAAATAEVTTAGEGLWGPKAEAEGPTAAVSAAGTPAAAAGAGTSSGVSTSGGDPTAAAAATPLEVRFAPEPPPAQPPPRPIATTRTQEPPAEWRLRIVRAKRKAMMIIAVVLAFRGRKHRARGLQRLDSLSYFIAQHLGSDLPRFVEEQATYRSTKSTAADLQALAEEVWREQNYTYDNDDADSVDPVSSSGLYLPGPIPTAPPPSSPRVHSSNNLPGSPSGAGGSSGHHGGLFRVPPPPQLRIPGSFNHGNAAGPAGGTSGAGGSGGFLGGSGSTSNNARSQSPLLKSRPVNLTPTLHHISQSGTGGSSTGMLSPGAQSPPNHQLTTAPTTPTGGTRASHSGSLPHTLSISSTGGAGNGSSGSAVAGNHAMQRGLPALRTLNNSGRMSTAGTDDVPTPTATGPAVGLSGPSAAAVASLSKNARFSAPGCEALLGVPGGLGAPVAAFGGGSASTNGLMPHGFMDDGSIVSIVESVAAVQGLTGNSKRWSSPRFLRGSTPAAPPSITASGGAPARRGAGGSHLAAERSLLALEDMSLVARAQSWAGPSGNVIQSRSLCSEGPVSPSGAGPSPPGHGHGSNGLGHHPGVMPAPPSLPSPATRNPRKRRESALVLSSSHSSSTVYLPPPTPNAHMRSPSHTGDGNNIIGSRSMRHGSTPHHSTVGRSGSAVTGSVMQSVRRPGRVGGSITGDAPFFAPSFDRPGSVAMSERSLTTSNTVRRLVRDGSSDQLYLRYQEEAAALEKPLRMMQLFANRANARWVEELAGGAPSLTPSGSTSSLSTAGGAAGAGPQSPSGGSGLTSGSGGQGGGWEPPYVHEAARFASVLGGAQASVFRAEVVAMLRAGRMAVQLLAGDDHILLGNGQPQPLWSADPWDLIATSFPARATAADRVRHVQMGPRLLMALVMAVEAMAGAEAVAKLVVVLHMTDSQLEDVVQEMKYRKYCGLRPENLILLVQQRRPGYVWDAEQTVFVHDEGCTLASAGSGYAIMQLVWPEEAFQLLPPQAEGANGGNGRQLPMWAAAGGAAAAAAASGSGAPVLVPLGASVLEFLANRGVDWLLTRRLRDISLYHPEMTLDPDVLAYTLYLHDHMGANMSVQVELVDTVTALRVAQAGVVLAPPKGGTGGAAPRRAGTLAAAASGGGGRSGTPVRRTGTVTAAIVASSGEPLRASSDVSSVSSGSSLTPGGEAGGGGGSGPSLHPHVVVDIKNTDTGTPRTMQMLNELRARAKGKLAVSTRRYMWRVDVLQTLVQRSSLFHPSLEVAGELAYLTFDMSDLTAATDYGARCVSVSARHPARSLTSVADLEDLLSAISAQDSHAPFRRMAGNVSLLYGPPVAASSLTGPPDGRPATAATPSSPSGSSAPPSVFGGGPSSSSSNSLAASYAAPGATPTNAGQRIVLLVADNESTAMAVQLLMSMVKAGRDAVMLVTVVGSVLGEPAGRALLRRHEATLAKCLVEVSTELLTKNPNSSLIDQLELYCDSVDAHLIVMGSQLLATATPAALGGVGGGSGGAAGGSTVGSGGSGITFSFGSGGGGGAGGGGGGGGGGASFGGSMGSVAVSLLRNAIRPMMIVKANAKYSNVVWDKDKLRVLVEVHHSSRNLLRYVITRLTTPQRIDKVLLVRGGAKDAAQQDTMTSRRLLENFSDIATQHHVPAVKRAVEEPFEVGAIRTADLEKAHLIALHAPAGRGVPNSIFNVLRAARSAVLVYKGTDAS